MYFLLCQNSWYQKIVRPLKKLARLKSALGSIFCGMQCAVGESHLPAMALRADGRELLLEPGSREPGKAPPGDFPGLS
jgi:hypothetical protein